jgi:alpha-beta hydrolase superfamily lysophospholipase
MKRLVALYRGARRWIRRLLWLAVVIVMTLLIGRAVQSQAGPPLELWHTFIPAEPDAAAIDHLDWDGYLAAEARTFAAIRAEVTEQLDEKERRPDDRYFAGSPVYSGNFVQDWNRSYVLEPAGRTIGAVVLLHGLTDSPYSLRHVAKFYQARGYLAIGLRLPGHGTVPAALTSTTWEDWLAATRLAVREARRRVPSNAPLHIVGYSAGGAAALKYALDALEDSSLPRPDRLVLISPMIGVSTFARFAGLAALPALLPPFAKAAWLTILPEFNPFKYNSFPVNAARQAHRLTVAIQQQLDRLATSGRLGALPPVLTFQSSVDFTVSATAVIESLYARLPPNGSELVLFDLNRNARFGPLLRAVFATNAERIVPPPPRDWQLTIIANTQDDPEVKERITAAGETVERVRGLGLTYPRDVFSPSHIALPFPADDPLYGSQPDPAENFGVALGSQAGHGEVGVLIVSLDMLARLTWNPFFPYVLARIGETIDPATVRP